MKTWETKLVVVKEEELDGNLHQLEVFNKAGKRLGAIIPPDIEDMKSCISALDRGECPIKDAWEDGLGNCCTLEGFGPYRELELPEFVERFEEAFSQVIVKKANGSIQRLVNAQEELKQVAIDYYDGTDECVIEQYLEGCIDHYKEKLEWLEYDANY